MGKIQEFQIFFFKMQNILSHEKVQHIVNKKPGSPTKKAKKSVQFVKPPEIKVEVQVPVKEKIKQQMKDNKKESKEKANIMIKDFSTKINNKQKEEVLGGEIEKQEESFRSRLEKKKLRSGSQPHKLLSVLINLTIKEQFS